LIVTFWLLAEILVSGLLFSATLCMHFKYWYILTSLAWWLQEVNEFTCLLIKETWVWFVDANSHLSQLSVAQYFDRYDVVKIYYITRMCCISCLLGMKDQNCSSSWQKPRMQCGSFGKNWKGWHQRQTVCFWQIHYLCSHAVLYIDLSCETALPWKQLLCCAYGCLCVYWMQNIWFCCIFIFAFVVFYWWCTLYLGQILEPIQQVRSHFSEHSNVGISFWV